MFKRHIGVMGGALLAGISGLIGQRLDAGMSPSAAYRTVQPVTTKNLGRNWLKYGNGKYRPHQGEREKARRRRQLAAGQIHFIKHGPSARGQS